jgi:hypothetical protein
VLKVWPVLGHSAYPTYAKTSLTRALLDDKDVGTVFTDVISLKRWDAVEDVANLAIFLAWDGSRLYPR